jgi:hypothetical protein
MIREHTLIPRFSKELDTATSHAELEARTEVESGLHALNEETT